MESFCDHLGIILGPFWDYLGIIFRYFLIVPVFFLFFLYYFFWNFGDHFGIILDRFFLTVFDIFLNYFLIFLGSFCAHFGIILDRFFNGFWHVLYYFWIFLGSFCDHFGIIWESLWDCFRTVFEYFHFFESFGNGPGAILGYSLIVFGYIRTIPSPFSGKILKFYFSYIFPYISPWGRWHGRQPFK